MFVIDYANGETPTAQVRQIAGDLARRDAIRFLIDQGSPVTPEAQQIVADAVFFARELPVAQRVVQAAEMREAERLSPAGLHQQSGFSRYTFLFGTRLMAALGLKNFLLQEPSISDNRTNNILSGNYDDSSKIRDRDDGDFRETVTTTSSFVYYAYNNFGTNSSLLTLFAAAKRQVFVPLERAVSSAVSIISSWRDAAVEAGEKAYKGAREYIGNILQSLPPARSIIAEMRKSFGVTGRELTDFAREEYNETSSKVRSLLERLREAGLDTFLPTSLVASRPTLAIAASSKLKPEVV